MIGSTIRQYKIQSELGKGGMGTVYLAKHISLPKFFAIKRLSLEFSKVPEFQQRFLEEANNQALLDHPGIVRATDLFEQDGYFYFVMDYVEGEDLDERIRSKGKLNEAEALGILKDLLVALQFAHDKNIVHRDIKPSNILITKDNRTLITDFGIAILLGGKRFTNFASNQASGTAWYMSPEQITLPESVDNRSDIYSLGIVLYEMLTGEVPFGNEERSEYNVKDQQVRAALPDPRQKNPNISIGVVKLMRKALEKNPNNRYQSCSEFLRELTALTTVSLTKQGSSTKSTFIVASVVTLAVGGMILFLTLMSEPEIVAQSDPKQVHDSAFILIQGATEQATLVCTKLQELPLKQSNLDIAQENGFFDLVDGYKTQIEEVKKTISDGNSKFDEIVVKLKAIEASIVAEEFKNFAAFLDKQGRLDQIPQLRLVNHFYENHSVGKVQITEDRCSKG